MTNLTCLLVSLALAAGPARATDARGATDAPSRNTAVTINPLALPKLASEPEQTRE